MNKRILSLLMAVIMLLSMLPVQALADDEVIEPVVVEAPVETTEIIVETQAPVLPEPTEAEVTEAPEVVETTEAVVEETEVATVVETTEATEPVVETEATEAAEETEVTEATEATEETEPTEETVAEEVVAESVTIKQEEELTELCVEETLQLTAEVLPEEAAELTVVWTSSNEEIATVDETGLVTGVAPGEVTITAACGEVEGTYDLVVLEAVTLDGEDVDNALGDYIIDFDVNNVTELLAGNYSVLRATVTPTDPDNKEIVRLYWELKDDTDYTYVNLASNGRLTVRPEIQVKKDIEIRAVVRNLKGVELDSADLPVPVTVVPRVREIILTVNTTDGEENVVNRECLLNLNDDVASNVEIHAKVLPEDAEQDITWVVGDTYDICDHDDDGQILTISPNGSGKTGVVVVTARAQDKSGRYARTTVRFVKLAKTLSITSAPTEMRGGDAKTLLTDINSNPDNRGLTDKTILWSVAFKEDADNETKDIRNYAAISATGRLTTRNVTESITIRVTATVKGSPDATDYVDIDLLPAVQSVAIEADSELVSPMEYVKDGEYRLVAKVLPDGASKKGTWTTSNKNIATVTPVDGVDGEATLKIVGAGNVRITFETSDGSRKRAMLYLEVTKPVNVLTIEAPENEQGDVEVKSGKTLQLKAKTWTTWDELDEENNVLATNQKVVWSIMNEDGEPTTAATIAANGKVTGKAVRVNTRVIAVARSQEDKEIYAEMPIIVKPEATKSLILKVDGEIVGDTKGLDNLNSYEITGYWYDSTTDSYEEAAGCTYSLSSVRDTAFVTLYEEGTLETKARGNATIIARCADTDTETGLQKMYTTRLTVQVTNRVDSVRIADLPKVNDAGDENSHDYFIRGGMSLFMRANVWANEAENRLADNKQLKWEVFELDGSGNRVETDVAKITATGVLTAKPVTEIKNIVVYATSVENSGAYDCVELTVLPRELYRMRFEYQGKEYTGTVVVPVNELADRTIPYSDLQAVVSVFNMDSDDFGDPNVTPDFGTDFGQVNWVSSNPRVAEVDKQCGDVKFVGSGTATLTATYKVKDNKDRPYSVTAKITFKTVVSVEDGFTIGRKIADQELYVNRTLTLMANVNSDASNKRVRWEIVDATPEGCAVINATTGVLTGKKPGTVRVRAVAVDGFGAECDQELEIKIYPKVKSIKLDTYEDKQKYDYPVSTFPYELSLNWVVEFVDEAQADEKLPLKWTSSNKAVAEIDQEGNITVKKKGAVIITATSQDGSNKRVSFTLNFK